jgi:hypothetical protein
MICAKCQRQKRGHTVIDNHHPFAEANDPKTTVPVSVNDHRADLNEAQNDWPRQTRENPDGSPLLAAAGTSPRKAYFGSPMCWKSSTPG